MRVMSGRTALLLSAAIAAATTAVSARSVSENIIARGGRLAGPRSALLGRAPGQQADKGEQILNGSCTTCHDLRMVEVQALDKAGWTGSVESMIQRGAEVASEDLPILIDYLVTNHGPLPDGPGKNIVLSICTMCHDLKRVRQNLATRAEWEVTLGAMLNEGAPLSEQDFPVVLSYLARNFKPE
jgi:cytochrome c5